MELSLIAKKGNYRIIEMRKKKTKREAKCFLFVVISECARGLRGEKIHER